MAGKPGDVAARGGGPPLGWAARAGLRIDLGLISDRPFASNASFGACAEVVQSPAYRDDKAGTTLQILPGLLSGHQRAHLVAWVDGRVILDGPQAVLVSNNSPRSPRTR